MASLRNALSTGFARKGTTHERYLPKYCKGLREQYQGRWWIHSCDLKELLAIKREREQRGNVTRRHTGQMREPWRIVSVRLGQVLVCKKQRYYGPKKSGNIEKKLMRDLQQCKSRYSLRQRNELTSQEKAYIREKSITGQWRTSLEAVLGLETLRA